GRSLHSRWFKHKYVSTREDSWGTSAGPFFFILVFGFIITVNYYHYRSRYSRFPTFEEYRARHPGLVRHGRAECFKCGGTKVYVRGLWNATDRRKTHFCSTCGTPLYKSKH